MRLVVIAENFRCYLWGITVNNVRVNIRRKVELHVTGSIRRNIRNTVLINVKRDVDNNIDNNPLTSKQLADAYSVVSGI